MPIVRKNLDWREPLLPQLADHLAAGWTSGPFDLSTVAIVVPTTQSGRRLREALTARAHAAGTGLLPPRFVTSEWILSVNLPESGIASPAESAAVWTALLLRLDLAQHSALFPVAPPRQNAAWAVALANELIQVRNTLAEHGLDFGLVADRTRNTPFEPDRWASLAVIEHEYKKALGTLGLHDRALAEQALADNPPTPPGIERIVLAAVPDPLPLSIRALEKLSGQLTIEILTHGPEDEPVFDAWGRPETGSFGFRSIDTDGGRCHSHLLANPASAAEETTRLAVGYRGNPENLCLAFGDADLTPLTERRLSNRNLQPFDPAGRSLLETRIGYLTSLLAELAMDPSVSVIGDLLRHPDFQEFQSTRRPAETGSNEILTAYDRILERHLPETLDDVMAFAGGSGGRSPALSAAIEEISRTQKVMAANFAPGLLAALSTLFGNRRLPQQTSNDLEQSDAAAAIEHLLDETDRLQKQHPDLPSEVWVRHLQRSLAREYIYLPRPENAFELLGWLEILYDDAPHLVVSGMNDGAIPESIHGHAFLPEKLREHLGLKTNADRFARDAYILSAAISKRANRGKTDLLVIKRNDRGDPVQPSRLLFQCPDENLPARVDQLFAEIADTAPQPARSVPWKLRPRAVAAPEKLTPSRLRAYLACPFRYYLEFELGMESYDAAKLELDAGEFGTLCHDALRYLVDSEEARRLRDPETLAQRLENAVDARARAVYGNAWSLPVRLQIDAAKARLRTAAQIEAEQRHLGWETVDTEFDFELTIDGIPIAGRIDRLDVHTETGKWRVIDYKTSDKPKTPVDAHWQSTGRNGPAPHVLPESVFEEEGRSLRWVDLQLPLYVLALRASRPGPGSAAYFNLARTEADSRLEPWPGLTQAVLESAQACASAIIAAIRGKRFWPPADVRTSFDSFARLFPDGPDSDFDAEALLKQQVSSKT